MAFKLKSGNSPLFKKMGATPAKDMKTGSYKHEFEDDSPAKSWLGDLFKKKDGDGGGGGGSDKGGGGSDKGGNGGGDKGGNGNGNGNGNGGDQSEIEGAKNLSDKLQVNKTKTLINKGKNALVAGFTSGLDAVYGTGKIQPNSGVVVEKKKGECVKGVNTITGEACKEESSDKFSNILNSGNNNNDIKDKPKK